MTTATIDAQTKQLVDAAREAKQVLGDIVNASDNDQAYTDAELKTFALPAYNKLDVALETVDFSESFSTPQQPTTQQPTPRPLSEPPYTLERNGKGNGNSLELNNEAGFPVARIYDDDRAAFILQAVNAHDGLVAALREALNYIGAESQGEVQNQIREALKLAEAE